MIWNRCRYCGQSLPDASPHPSAARRPAPGTEATWYPPRAGFLGGTSLPRRNQVRGAAALFVFVAIWASVLLTGASQHPSPAPTYVYSQQPQAPALPPRY